jgi:hypothetical protein
MYSITATWNTLSHEPAGGIYSRTLAQFTWKCWVFSALTGFYLSEECSRWQQYQKLLQVRRQCLTAREVLPAILRGIVWLDAFILWQAQTSKLEHELLMWTRERKNSGISRGHLQAQRTVFLCELEDTRTVMVYTSTLPHNVVLYPGDLSTAQTEKMHHSPTKKSESIRKQL